jgi:nucleotide-binding universal stress UspA family protein
MKRILIAVNEDPIAARVVEFAGRLAQETHAALDVCHIISRQSFESLQESIKWQRNTDETFTYSQAEDQARAIASALAEGLRPFKLTWHAYGRVGDPASEIVNLAEEIQADCITLGFEGLHGIGKLRALGSVSRAVLEQTTLPVLVVPALKAATTESILKTETKGVLAHGTKLFAV